MDERGRGTPPPKFSGQEEKFGQMGFKTISIFSRDTDHFNPAITWAKLVPSVAELPDRIRHYL